MFLHVSVYHSQCMQLGMQVLAQHAVVEAARSDVQRLEARERDVREVLQVGQTGQRSPNPNPNFQRNCSDCLHSTKVHCGLSAAALLAEA